MTLAEGDKPHSEDEIGHQLSENFKCIHEISEIPNGSMKLQKLPNEFSLE